MSLADRHSVSTSNVLPVDFEPSSLFLRTAEGEPVWPIHDAEDRKAITYIARLCSGVIAKECGVPMEKTEWQSAEEVVALGEGFVELEGRLYAHLTRRGFRSVRRVAELNCDNLPAVLITTSEHVHHQLLDVLYNDTLPGPATGLLFASHPKLLRRQVLLRSAAAALAGLLTHRRISFLPLVDFGCYSVPELEPLGSQANDAHIRSALARGAGVLTISTHSDGIDAFLTQSLTLCPFDRWPKYADPDRSPRCCVTGYCHRSQVPVGQAWGEDRLLPAEAISARVLIWNVCSGFLPSSGNLAKVIDGAWGLMPRFLENPSIGAVLTTWYQTVSAPHQVEPLAEAIATGTPLGMAIASYLKSPQAHDSGIRFCLLGDPRLRLPVPATGAKEVRLEPDQPVACVSSVSVEALDDASFLRAWLSVAARKAHGKAGDSARSVLKTIEAYEMEIWQGLPVEEDAASPGPAMRKALAEHLVQHGTLTSQYWLQVMGKPKLLSPAPACFACGLPSNAYVLKANTARFEPRRLGLCPGCGVIEDVPNSTSMSLKVDENLGLHLTGAIPSQHWTCQVVAGSTLQSDFTCWEWPADSEGRPVKVFQLPGPFPPGPLRIVLLLLWDAKLAMLQQPGRYQRGH